MSGLIHKFGKNAIEEVRVSLTEYKGHELMDFRVYYCPSDGEPVPTKKGLTMSVELYANLRDAILKLGEELEKQVQS
jgi:hypothetical protein